MRDKSFDDFKTALENLANKITPEISYMLIMIVIIVSILISRGGVPAPYTPMPVTPVFIR